MTARLRRRIGELLYETAGSLIASAVIYTAYGCHLGWRRWRRRPT